MVDTLLLGSSALGISVRVRVAASISLSSLAFAINTLGVSSREDQTPFPYIPGMGLRLESSALSLGKKALALLTSQ